MTRALIRSLAVAALAAALAGCISVFPKAAPATLYRFGMVDAPLAAGPPSAASVTRGQTGFPPGSAGDRILTVTGQENAYISGARWTAPAVLMFDDALARAFDRRPGAPRLITRGDLMTSGINLRLDVDAFEARYLDGKDSAPTVVVSLRASLVRIKDRTVIGETDFEARQRAADNRVGAIVEAFDTAVKDVLGKVVDWTAGQMTSA